MPVRMTRHFDAVSGAGVLAGERINTTQNTTATTIVVPPATYNNDLEKGAVFN